MQALHREFTKIINGTTQFTIPVFQRDYAWAESNCEQLWNDIIRVGTSDISRVHFLGSLVYVPTGESSAGFTQYQVIDGQQRLTTWTLLMIALRDHIVETGFSGAEDGPTAKRIDAYFLKNEQEDRERRYKLILRRHDESSLRALIDGRDLPSDASENISDNYDLFRGLLKTVDPALVYRGLGRLIVVDVKLDATDNPQLVFESLNSTGVDLSQSDLIRNFILMRLPEKEQTKLYNDRWSKIETLFRGSDRTFDAFARDYLALRTHASKQEKASNIYRAFREVFDEFVAKDGSLDKLLEHMQRHATYYAAFSLSVGVPKPLQTSMSRLKSLVDVPAILVMHLFECHQKLRTMTEAEFQEALALLESYVLRRSICDGQTRGYWQIFADIAEEIDVKKPLSSLKGILASQHESYRYPSDPEFQRCLKDRDLYNTRICWHVLEQLENHGSKEITDTSALQIEHIVPQNPKLNAAWQKMLGKNWRDVQQAWLHRLGNLTLTGYNSKYSDRSFEDKKTIDDGFEESAVRLNKFVRDQKKWTEAEMQRRSGLLASRAVKVWPPLVADPALVKEIQKARLRRRAAKKNVEAVSMTEYARELFDLLRVRVKKLDSDVTEMAETKSVSYHAPVFFLEVLPRKDYLTLLLPLEFNEVTDASGIVKDVTQWKFITNSQYSCGVLLSVENPADIEAALPFVHQAMTTAHVSA
jgi:uncharacterized protein with ParB-like and HNH nuclease domain/predicted transport protein